MKIHSLVSLCFFCCITFSFFFPFSQNVANICMQIESERERDRVRKNANIDHMHSQNIGNVQSRYWRLGPINMEYFFHLHFCCSRKCRRLRFKCASASEAPKTNRSKQIEKLEFLLSFSVEFFVLSFLALLFIRSFIREKENSITHKKKSTEANMHLLDAIWPVCSSSSRVEFNFQISFSHAVCSAGVRVLCVCVHVSDSFHWVCKGKLLYFNRIYINMSPLCILCACVCVVSSLFCWFRRQTLALPTYTPAHQIQQIYIYILAQHNLIDLHACLEIFPLQSSRCCFFSWTASRHFFLINSFENEKIFHRIAIKSQ